jgi:hypothetical protein
MRAPALLSLLGALGAGCATSTITSRPPGAAVFVDGREICSATPCQWASPGSLPRRHHLQLRKPGYRDVDLYLDRELAPSTATGACCLGGGAALLGAGLIAGGAVTGGAACLAGAPCALAAPMLFGWRPGTDLDFDLSAVPVAPPLLGPFQVTPLPPAEKPGSKLSDDRE